MHAVGLPLCEAISGDATCRDQIMDIAHMQGSWLQHAPVQVFFVCEKQPAF